MLFGALAALITLLGGVLAGLDYLVLIGAVVFMLFSFMMLLYLFGHYLNSRRGSTANSALAERVDGLSRKLEALSAKAVSGAGSSYPGEHQDKERELEHKVEELRMLVKTLAKSVERQDE
jgi:Flp pilus assembly protein TadB